MPAVAAGICGCRITRAATGTVPSAKGSENGIPPREERILLPGVEGDQPLCLLRLSTGQGLPTDVTGDAEEPPPQATCHQKKA
jgi:hypothetical protein